MTATRRAPPEPDWRVRRAEYLVETGRLDQLKAEGLEHFVREPVRARRPNA